MSAAGHTPEPWYCTNVVAGFLKIETNRNGGGEVARVKLGRDGRGVPNAKLIASAPALADALGFVAKWFAMRESKGETLPSQLTEAVADALRAAGRLP